VDPVASLTVLSGGNPRFPVGTPVFLRTISGHRDTGFTECPGNALYALIGAIARQAAQIGLPKLYAPSVQGAPGGAVTFRARLSIPEAWTVTVTDASRAVIASGSGSGTDVNWSWNAVGVPQARYAWTISAGPDILPATGFVGAAPVPLALKSASVKPATIDGTSTKTTLVYSLTTTAQVTGVLRTGDGRQLSTLFQQQLRAGKHSFTFSAATVPDGRYTIVINATDGKTTVSASLPLVVDRTLSRFAVAPRVFSPNSDGRDDTVAFTFHLVRPAQVRVDVKRGAQVVATVANAADPAGDQMLRWDGAAAQGRIPDGKFTAVATVESSIGTTRHSVPVGVDTVAPRLRVLSLRRLVFWISEPARVTLVINGRSYTRKVRTGVFAARVVRVVHRAVVSAEDAAGNVSRILRFP
jgi:hypothetical protein